MLPIDVTRSEWNCTLENRQLRMGLRYVKGLRAEAGAAIVRARPFADIDDLARRASELRKDEMAKLAETGALNPLKAAHRRDALWKSARATRPTGPLLEEVPETEAASPLLQMTTEERLAADYRGTGLTVGRHPMAYRRAEMHALGVTPARDLPRVASGGLVRIAGSVIVRQRPGTAKGIVFLTLEDETGISNAVVMPDLFESQRLLLVTEPWLLIEGVLQNVDTVIHVLARRVAPIPHGTPGSPSHNFH